MLEKRERAKELASAAECLLVGSEKNFSCLKKIEVKVTSDLAQKKLKKFFLVSVSVPLGISALVFPGMGSL